MGCVSKGKGCTERIIKGKEDGAKHIFQGIYRPQISQLNRNSHIFLEKLFQLRNELQSEYLMSMNSATYDNYSSNNSTNNNNNIRPSMNSTGTIHNLQPKQSHSIYNIHNNNNINKNEDIDIEEVDENQYRDLQNIKIGLINKQDMILYIIPYMKQIYDILKHQRPQINLNVNNIDTKTNHNNNRSNSNNHSNNSNNNNNNTNNMIAVNNSNNGSYDTNNNNRFPVTIEVYLTQFFHKQKSNADIMLRQLLSSHSSAYNRRNTVVDNNNNNNHDNNNNNTNDNNNNNNNSNNNSNEFEDDISESFD